jgi:hypothetical protein
MLSEGVWSSCAGHRAIHPDPDLRASSASMIPYRFGSADSAAFIGSPSSPALRASGGTLRLLTPCRELVRDQPR